MNLRTMAVLSGTAALLGVTLVAAPQADAANVYACVKKNGSARIATKKPKCKRGETMLSWNTLSGKDGLKGRNATSGRDGTNGRVGANGIEGSAGTEGRAGVNGAVAGYAAAQAGEVSITTGKEIVVLSKTLPAGHYLLSAKVQTSASSKSSGFVRTECDLFDAGILLDVSQWTGAFSELVAGTFITGATLPLQAMLNTTATTTVSLTCETTLSKATGAELTASKGQLLAIQTSSNN